MAVAERLLLVEDEILIAMLYELQLRELGYPLWKRCTTGEHALGIARERMPDLLLIDIRLAGPMDGIETARQIRAMAPVPIIFMSGYASPELRARAMELAPVAYLEKPVQVPELRQALEKLGANGNTP